MSQKSVFCGYLSYMKIGQVYYEIFALLFYHLLVKNS